MASNDLKIKEVSIAPAPGVEEVVEKVVEPLPEPIPLVMSDETFEIAADERNPSDWQITSTVEEGIIQAYYARNAKVFTGTVADFNKALKAKIKGK
jgi:hypothetical protein